MATKRKTMNTKELDAALMQQYSIESMLKPSCDAFKLTSSKNQSIAAMQVQAPDYCFKSKGFLCSHYVDPNAPEGKFSLFMKLHMTTYKDNLFCQNNQAMKHLYNKDINILYQQISMLTMHAQFKDVEDILNVDNEVERRSLDPESVSIGIGLYVYYTILINNSLDALSFNELFVKSWYCYYDNWMTRRLMFKMNGNNWKLQFKGVLLD